MIYGHGDDLYRSGREVKANFSTNVWYEADTAPLCRFLEEKLETVFHYPEPDAGSFCRVAADYHGVSPRNVLAGNGATELFYRVAHAFAGSCTLLPVPSFTEYEDACSLYGHRLVFLPRTDVSALPAGELMFICNPNNPDGRIWTQDDICRILETCPDRVLVVDESFIGFAPEAQTAVGLLKKYANLLIVRSMTKCYAIPGLRLGYLLGGEQLIERVGRFALPWSVNVLAIEAGKFLLEHGASGLPDAIGLLQRQREFSGRIAQIPGFRPVPSHTSFFLTETDYDSSALKTYLLEHNGLLIRDASNFRGLDNHYFRVNTLTDEKNAMLTDALEAYARIQGGARRIECDV